MKATPILHPFLIAAFPVLALLAANLDWIPVTDAVRTLVFALLSAAGLLVLTWLFTRDLPRAGLLTSLVLLLFFSYGHVYGSLKDLGLGATIARHRYLIPAGIALLIGGSLWIIRYLRDPTLLTRIANVASAALILLPLAAIGSEYLGPRGESHQAPTEQALTPSQDPPDIYYVVVDGYGRQDTLQTVYEFDNEPFLQSLEELGFYIARKARANYAQTSLGLASALNMNYVEELLPEQEYGRDRLWDLIQNSEVRRQLKGLGYEVVAFSTGLEGTEWRDADRYLSPAALEELAGPNAFESMLAQTTAIRALIDGVVAVPRLIRGVNYPYDIHRERLRHTMEGLASLPPSDRPRFVFAHLILPHPPFVFDAQGRPLTPDAPFSLDFPSGWSSERYISGYKDQLTFLNGELERALNEILEESASPPIIVLQADHGPDSNSGRQSYAQERMTILNALLLPNGNEALWPHITPVNSFRVVFNQVFAGDYERLPDRALYSEYDSPFEFIDVTGSVLPP